MPRLPAAPAASVSLATEPPDWDSRPGGRRPGVTTNAARRKAPWPQRAAAAARGGRSARRGKGSPGRAGRSCRAGEREGMSPSTPGADALGPYLPAALECGGHALIRTRLEQASGHKEIYSAHPAVFFSRSCLGKRILEKCKGQRRKPHAQERLRRLRKRKGAPALPPHFQESSSCFS